MWILALCIAGCLCGFVLFRTRLLATRHGHEPSLNERRLSVIIPARNEACNLPHLLESLRLQTVAPYEVIVVDDGSVDGTREIAESYGVKVVTGMSLPAGWTGKNWAVWNGRQHAAGELLLFLDADIRLAPQAVGSLIEARERSGGVISVVPYHQTEKLYEKLALITNLLGVFAFTSPGERRNPRKGLYGACILATKEDYDRINGHASIKSEVLDDLFLGSKFMEAGIPVTNFLGCGMVSFRMYPQGIRSELEGFSKGAILSTSTLSKWTIIPIALWVIGLIVSGSAVCLMHTPWALPLAIAYLLYMLQIFYLIKYVGAFGVVMPVLHCVSSLFFIVIMLYSAYQVVFLKRVAWKGRHIQVGGRRDR
ncbi:glycosyltransferase [Paenibacillus aestuarii]|uniref:Glycosyltransferase n=1 Tax=Paenibacillus aestuarii TaxID=516965 RepID=A0ABW0KEL1_9BACL|nr:glycosyltransferase [Paenibacillus aestuarii]